MGFDMRVCRKTHRRLSNLKKVGPFPRTTEKGTHAFSSPSTFNTHTHLEKQSLPEWDSTSFSQTHPRHCCVSFWSRRYTCMAVQQGSVLSNWDWCNSFSCPWMVWMSLLIKKKKYQDQSKFWCAQWITPGKLGCWENLFLVKLISTQMY